VKQFSLLFLCLLIPLVNTGCDEVNAATSAPASQPLWTSADVARVLEDLRSIREQKKLLEEVRESINAQHDATSSLADSIASISTQLEGIEQRLDSPVDPPAAVHASQTPIASHQCITINGIDYDLSDFIADNYQVPWTWIGDQTLEGLREHLLSHGIGGIDGLSFPTLRKLHAAVHEKENSAVGTRRAAGATGNLQLFGDMELQNNPPDSGLAVNPPAPPEPEVHSRPVHSSPVKSRTVTITQASPTSTSVSTRSRTVGCPGGICPAPRVSYQQNYYRSAPRARFRLFR